MVESELINLRWAQIGALTDDLTAIYCFPDSTLLCKINQVAPVSFRLELFHLNGWNLEIFYCFVFMEIKRKNEMYKTMYKIKNKNYKSPQTLGIC